MRKHERLCPAGPASGHLPPIRTSCISAGSRPPLLQGPVHILWRRDPRPLSVVPPASLPPSCWLSGFLNGAALVRSGTAAVFGQLPEDRGLFHGFTPHTEKVLLLSTWKAFDF